MGKNQCADNNESCEIRYIGLSYDAWYSVINALLSKSTGYVLRHLQGPREEVLARDVHTCQWYFSVISSPAYLAYVYGLYIGTLFPPWSSLDIGVAAHCT